MCTEMLADEGPAPLDHEQIADAARELASRGQRVLAFAHRELGEPLGDASEISSNPTGWCSSGCRR